VTRSQHPRPWTVYPSAPWEAAGLHCPHDRAGSPQHQPYPDPWWAGESVFAPLAEGLEQPTGPFFILPSPEHPDTFPAHLQTGDVLLSPAQRHVLPWGMAQAGFDGQCSRYAQYDAHVVYITTDRGFFDFGDYTAAGVTGPVVFFEVVPDGRLWPDPEAPTDATRWCCRQATITAVHTIDIPEED
jgi:hypothetical protein